MSQEEALKRHMAAIGPGGKNFAVFSAQSPNIETRLAELLASAKRHYNLSPEGLALDFAEHRRTHYGEDADPLWPRLRRLIMERHLPAGYYEDRRRRRDLHTSEDLLQAHAMLSTWAALPENERLEGARKLHAEIHGLLKTPISNRGAK